MIILSMVILMVGNTILFWSGIILQLPLVLDSVLTLMAALVLGPIPGLIVGAGSFFMMNLTIVQDASFLAFAVPGGLLAFGFGKLLTGPQGPTISRIVGGLLFFSLVAGVSEAIIIARILRIPLLDGGGIIMRGLFLGGVDYFTATFFTRLIQRIFEYTISLLLAHGLFKSLKTSHRGEQEESPMH